MNRDIFRSKILRRAVNNVDRLQRETSQVVFFLVLLFSAFIGGNVFGIFSQKIGNPLGFFILNICFIELVSFIKYSNFFLFVTKSYMHTRFFANALNAIKRGFLIGIFVEAFKVGS